MAYRETINTYRIDYRNGDSTLTASVQCTHFADEWTVFYRALGDVDTDYRGTYGTGCKVFNTKSSAMASARKYVDRWSSINHF